MGFRAALLGVEEVVGKPGMAIVLRQAHLEQYIGNYPPHNMEFGGQKGSYLSQIDQALFEIYGKRGARAILQQVGRGQAKSGIAEAGPLVNATKMALKLLPLHRQMKMVLDTMCKEINVQTSTSAKIVEDGDVFYYDDPTCNHCMNWRYESPVCYVVVGFVRDMLSFLIPNHQFKVEETECFAKGDEICRFRISVVE